MSVDVQRRYHGSHPFGWLLSDVQWHRMWLTHRSLRHALINMAKRDRDMRVAHGKGKPWDWSVDRRHTRRMKAIVQQYGWPTFRMVGKRGADAAWYLVQHADHDVAWQERCLALMRSAMTRGQATQRLFAMLTDRVLVNQGKWQLYGTQWCSDRGTLELRRPIRDRRRLAARRRVAGMNTFREAKRDMQRRYREWRPGPT